jgi:AraC-like DNA-binding protein
MRAHEAPMDRPAGSPQYSDPNVRISGVVSLPSVLEQLGADPRAVFAKARVSLSLFDEPTNPLPITAAGRLIKESVAATGCEHFGLLVGQNGGPQSFGMVGLLAKYSPDVQTALLRLGTYLHLYHGGQVMRLDAGHDVSILSYAIVHPGVEAVDQIEDGALAIFFKEMRSLCGPEWLPLEVRFAHRRPTNDRPFARFFQTSLRFDAEQSALVFRTDWLRRKLPNVDVEIERLLLQQIAALAAKTDEEFPDLVRSVLRNGLIVGQADADSVAALFSIHRRTMTRRLAKFGTTFEELADETRFEMGKRMLAISALDISHIAASLSYSDASAFSRAFRRWSGTTPAAWRALHAGG